MDNIFLSFKDLILLKRRANEIIFKDLAEYPLYHINNLLKYFKNAEKLLEIQLNYDLDNEYHVFLVLEQIKKAIATLKRENRLPRLDNDQQN